MKARKRNLSDSFHHVLFNPHQSEQGSALSNPFQDHNIQDLSSMIPDEMLSRSWFRFGLLICLLCAILSPASSVPAGNSTTYSFIHLSDTQNLATSYPGRYDFTFSYLESIKKPYNLSAIIITGDVVNSWNQKKEWDAYARARNMTTIPVYEIAGNHDADYGNNYKYYTLYTGEPDVDYVTSFEDFDLVGINYAEKSLLSDEFSRLQAILTRSSRSNVIIATHYYMDEKGQLSPLGEDIDKNLIVRPSLVLMGHMHGNFIKQRTVGGFPVIADMTNYQDGVPGGKTGSDYSAGTLYTVTSVDGQVETITAQIVHIYPIPSLEEKKTVFERDPGASSRPITVPGVKGTLPSLDLPATCSPGDLSCVLNLMIERVCAIIRSVIYSFG
jgi:hypothetical protein